MCRSESPALRLPSIPLRCIEATARWRTVQGSSLDAAKRNRGIVRWQIMARVDLERTSRSLVRHVALRRVPRLPSIPLRCIEATARLRTVQGSSLDGAKRNRGIVRWRIISRADFERTSRSLVRHVDLRRDATAALDSASLHRGYGVEATESRLRNRGGRTQTI